MRFINRHGLIGWVVLPVKWAARRGRCLLFGHAHLDYVCLGRVPLLERVVCAAYGGQGHEHVVACPRCMTTWEAPARVTLADAIIEILGEPGTGRTSYAETTPAGSSRKAGS